MPAHEMCDDATALASVSIVAGVCAFALTQFNAMSASKKFYLFCCFSDLSIVRWAALSAAACLLS